MITVYSKNACPQCVMLKNLLTSQKVSFETKMLDEDYTMEDFQALQQTAGVVIRSFPAVFDSENHFIGSLTEMKMKIADGSISKYKV